MQKKKHTSALNNRSSSVCSVINWDVSEDKDKIIIIKKMRITPRKKHKKIIYKYIDLHMPVTRKGAGGANASARMRFSGPTTAMKERRRRDTHT